jgi:hypothetical protein
MPKYSYQSDNVQRYSLTKYELKRAMYLAYNEGAVAYQRMCARVEARHRNGDMMEDPDTFLEWLFNEVTAD